VLVATTKEHHLPRLITVTSVESPAAGRANTPTVMQPMAMTTEEEVEVIRLAAAMAGA
jgi:hypothetical protein